MQVDAQRFRRVMGLFATGVTVVTAQNGREMRGMTANAFCSVSLEPLLLLVCIHRDARMLEHIRAAGAFAVNVLSAEQEAVSRHFSGARGGTTPEFRFVPWEGGPLLVGCLGAAGCTVERVVDAGDHAIVVGRVLALHEGEPGRAPLVFWGGRYRRLQEWSPVPAEAVETFDRASARIYYED